MAPHSTPAARNAGWSTLVRNVLALMCGSHSSTAPIRLAAGKPGRRIKVGAGPGAIAITPDGRTAYVANYLGNTVTPITLATGEPGHPIKAGNEPGAIAITPDGRTAYVTNYSGDTVTPIDLATGKVGETPWGRVHHCA